MEHGRYLPIKNQGFRPVGRSENPGEQVVMWWPSSAPPVEIGSSDLQKSGGAMSPPDPPATTGLGLHLHPCIPAWFRRPCERRNRVLHS